MFKSIFLISDHKLIKDLNLKTNRYWTIYIENKIFKIELRLILSYTNKIIQLKLLFLFYSILFHSFPILILFLPNKPSNLSHIRPGLRGLTHVQFNAVFKQFSNSIANSPFWTLILGIDFNLLKTSYRK